MTELVFASSSESKGAHKNLYHLSESSYIIAGEDLMKCITELRGDVSRLHIASSWNMMVTLATGKTKPNRGDLFLLLRSAGIRAEELVPFRESETADIFPWLYYGRRFDVLRKICQTARTNAERYLQEKSTRVYCHLVVEDTGEIIASSL